MHCEIKTKLKTLTEVPCRGGRHTCQLRKDKNIHLQFNEYIYIETDQHEQCVNYRDYYYIKYIAPQLTEKKKPVPFWF